MILRLDQVWEPLYCSDTHLLFIRKLLFLTVLFQTPTSILFLLRKCGEEASAFPSWIIPNSSIGWATTYLMVNGAEAVPHVDWALDSCSGSCLLIAVTELVLLPYSKHTWFRWGGTGLLETGLKTRGLLLGMWARQAVPTMASALLVSAPWTQAFLQQVLGEEVKSQAGNPFCL